MADIVIDRSDAQIKAGIEKIADVSSSASEIDSIVDSQSEAIDLVNTHGITEDFLVNALTGVISASSSYDITNYIPIEQSKEYVYNGFMIYDTGIAGYDANFNFVETVVRAYDVNPLGVYTYTFSIENENIKYIVASIKKTIVPTMSIINTEITTIQDLKTKTISLEYKNQDDIYLTFGTNEFNAFIINEKNEYLRHHFEYRNEATYNDIGWYSDSINEDANEIVQGNIHCVMIVRDEASDDNIYIGHGHGCEEELYSNFYLDGIEFNPLTQTENLYGKEFRIITYSKYYRPNKTNSEATGTTYTVAQLPLEEVATRVSEVTFQKYNKIKKEHTIKSLVNGLHFRELFTAMQQTNIPYFNGKLVTNDRDGTRNHFPTSYDTPEPLSPSSVTMHNINYGDKNSFADTLIADGDYLGKKYLCSTKISNKNSSLNSKINLRAYNTRLTSNKFYFIPVNTYSLFSTDGTPYDTFDIGETISTIADTKISIG